MRHKLILLAALLVPATPAVAQVTVDLRALDALPATGHANPESHRPASVRHAPTRVQASKPAVETSAAKSAAPTSAAMASARTTASAQAVANSPAAPSASTATTAPPAPSMDAAPPALAQLTPIQPPAAPRAHPTPPPAPPIAADAATKAAATGTGLRVSFAPGNADLSPSSAAAIKQLVGSAPPGGSATFNVVAYATATPGDPSTSRRLSLSRALAVRSALVADGVDSSRIYVRAMGSNVPSGPADRVDVTLLGSNDPSR